MTQTERINQQMDSQVKRLLAKAVEYENMKRELAEAKRHLLNMTQELGAIHDVNKFILGKPGFSSEEFDEQFNEAVKFLNPTK